MGGELQKGTVGVYDGKGRSGLRDESRLFRQGRGLLQCECVAEIDGAGWEKSRGSIPRIRHNLPVRVIPGGGRPVGSSTSVSVRGDTPHEGLGYPGSPCQYTGLMLVEIGGTGRRCRVVRQRVGQEIGGRNTNDAR